ncbi:hypothetical protein ACFX1Q_030381 [Malus domestica]
MPKAPPMLSKMRSGHGSQDVSGVPMIMSKGDGGRRGFFSASSLPGFLFGEVEREIVGIELGNNWELVIGNWEIHGGGEKMKKNRHSFLCRFPQMAPNVDAQNRRSWNNVNPTVNLHESK